MKCVANTVHRIFKKISKRYISHDKNDIPIVLNLFLTDLSS